MQKPKNLGGRPKKTLADLPDGWQEAVLKEMTDGASLEEIYVLLHISDQTYTRFMKEEPSFLKVINEGKRYSKAWWLRNGRVNLENKSFNYVGWYMNMKNRFGWVDKQQSEITGKNGDPIESNATITYMPKQLPDDYFDKPNAASQ